MKGYLQLFILLSLFAITKGVAQTTTQSAILTVNSGTTYQKITGFGGFVCSPQFGYDHMTPDEIKKMWGQNSEAGYNIMRLYIPIAAAGASESFPSSWSSSLATAQLGKSLGIKIFASPWSMPTEWKTYNSIGSVFVDGNNVKYDNSLLPIYYPDYANYLNGYATYLKQNGAELDAISIQNEPDYRVEYAGCLWSPTQISDFVKDYGQLINSPIMAPEAVGFTDNYSAAFTNDAVLANLKYFAGHQYGSTQTGLKLVQAKGKEVWMTEYLINWNPSGNTPRNFDWSKDAFDFAGQVNSAMLSNVNAWVHYATKRYYGLMGDGTYGSTVGEITKRGYILSHFAKYAIGKTRVGNAWADGTGKLTGSTYISDAGDSVVVMVINPATTAYDLTVDLPFYTTSGKMIKTTESVNMALTDLSFTTETVRPKISISPSSFTTLVFAKSSSRIASQMTGAAYHYNKIEDQVVTNAAFGTTYQLSGKTSTFYNGFPLISANATNANGYLKLDDRYNQLVFNIKSISSTNLYSSNITLYYINGAGATKSYNYGSVNFDRNGNYDWVLDISRKVLTDGCTGILGIVSGNYSSKLTIEFGDVYFRVGDEKMFKFGGTYSNGDSNELDCLDNLSYTSLDYTGTSGITSAQNWNASATNKNCIYYVNGSAVNTNPNVIAGTSCTNLSLTDVGGNFYAPVGFTATAATYNCTFNGYRMLTLPYEATIPSGISAYTLQYSATEVNGSKITNGKVPANTPVLITGSGTFSFNGTGSVSTPHNVKVNDMNAVYIATKAYAGSYYLNTVNGVTALYKSVSGSEPTINSFSSFLEPSISVTASNLPLKLDGVLLNTESNSQIVNSFKIYPNPVKDVLNIDFNTNNTLCEIFDIQGKMVLKLVSGSRQFNVSNLAKGIYTLKITDSEKTLTYKIIKE
ncbi:MAG: T9SS type A sorting domain-containing protein [Flavobacterium sp.]|nr:T9SS type A sorting domain-containing protein [Flavobacterium sp.]